MSLQSNNMKSGELQKRGQKFYRHKEYRAALECFNAVISQEDQHLLVTLDNRAATLTKLGDLQAALKDARLMIKKDKTNHTGYLRTGKILQMLDKDDVALGIYKYGLDNVPPDDPNIELLRAMCTKLMSRCHATKLVDPLTVLPLELVEMVFGQLRFTNIVNLLSVSWRWNNFLKSIPSLWRILDLSATGRVVRKEAIDSYIKCSRGAVTKVTYFWSSSNRPKYAASLKYITSHCKDLQHLEIPRGFVCASLREAATLATNLKTLIVSAECDIPLDTVNQVVVLCRSLERAEFHSILAKKEGDPVCWPGLPSKIASMTLVGSANVSKKRSIRTLGLDSLFELIPNVRKLDIRRWEVRPGSFDFDFTPLAQLQDLHIARLDLTIHPRLPPSLQSLNMVGCCMVNWAAPATQANMKECPLPELTTLSFGKRYNIRVDELYLILDANLGNLKHLDIRACALSAQDINKLIEFGYLSDIVDLELPEAVDDGIAKALAKNLHFLKTLTIGASRKITGVGVKALVMKSHSKLEYLNIDHCMSVGIDAVDFARSQGITVRFAFPDRTGKRVWTA